MSKVEAIYLKDYKAPEYKIESVELVFDLFEEYALVTNVMKLEKMDESTSNITLDTLDLELEELWINDLKLDSFEEETIILQTLDAP